ncbi:hypothetical protein DXG01_015636 [Tephrocybe rancida]|nr:hypothetical protein DXG01_015636 [Tephrocybe rancida]
MSKSSSAWSMVALFMGSPKIRPSRKRKDKETTPTHNQPHTQSVDAPIQSLKSAASVIDASSNDNLGTTPESTSGKRSSTESREGSTGVDELLSRARAAESPDEPEHDWTTVTTGTQQDTSSSNTGTFETPQATDDMVDVLSQSVSVEFLEQQTQPSSDVPFPPLPPTQRSNEGELVDLETERNNMEERLLTTLRELSDVDRRNRELHEENDRQGQELAQAKAAVLVLQDQLLISQQTELQAARNAEDCRGQYHVLEEASKAQTEKLLKAEHNLRLAQQGREEAESRLEESLKGNAGLEEVGRKLLDAYRAKEKELERLRDVNSETDAALHTALIDLEHERQDRREVALQLNEKTDTTKDLTDRNIHLHDGLVEAKRELVEMRSVNTEARGELERAQAELKTVSQAKVALEEEISRQETRVTGMEKELRSLRRLGAEVAQKQGQTGVLERRNRMLMDQLRRQSSELRQQSPFSDIPNPRALSPVAKADLIASALGMVNRLNSDIFQVAAHMAESLEFSFGGDSNTNENRAAVERASTSMGRPLALLLNTLSQRADAEFDPLPVQIGLQACLASASARMIASWCPGHWDYADFIATIYSRIAGTTPGLAPRWRAITERQLKTPSDATVQAEMEEYLFKNLADALTVSGWKKSPESARDLLAVFRERITQIAKLALRLNTTLGDELEVFAVDSDELFNAEHMDDAYTGDGDEDREDAGAVMCTTDLGLKTSLDGSITLKPKIILQAMLTEEAAYVLS